MALENFNELEIKDNYKEGEEEEDNTKQILNNERVVMMKYVVLLKL